MYAAHYQEIKICSNSYATNRTGGGSPFIEQQQQGVSIDMDLSISRAFRRSSVDGAKVMNSFYQKKGKIF